MKLVILTKRKTYEEEPLPFTDVTEIEITDFRWNYNHVFEYVRKGSPIWEKLKSNQDIMGLSL